jgi:di/tricarboxylate transporter
VTSELAAAWVAINLIGILGLLVFTRLKPWVVFITSSALLYLTGILPLEKVAAGYTNPSLLVLILLYFVSIPLERTTLVRRTVSAIVNSGRRRSILRLGMFSACISSIINNTAVVAAMLAPLKKQQYIAPSKLLLPLSYASIVGGTVTLIGTSTNLIVNGFVQQAGYPSLNFFEFSAIGIPVMLGCLITMVLIAPRLLPDRETQVSSATQEYFLERQILNDSPLIGRSVQENGLRQLEKIFLVEIIRSHHTMAPVSPQMTLEEGDILVFSGDVSAFELLDDFQGLASPEHFDQTVRENLVEVIVSPTSGVVGRTIKAVDFRSKCDAAVVAVRRGNERLQGGLGNLALKAGDSLILAAGHDFSRRNEAAADFIVVGGIETNRSLSSTREKAVFAGFGVIVALGATGFVPLLKGLVVLTGILLVTRILTVNDLRARFPYQLLIVIGSALGLSQAMFDTGLSQWIGDFAATNLSGLPLLGALIGVFALTWLLTELVTNNAAAAIMFPLAMSISAQWGGDYLPFVMAVAFGASASFMSPYGYQTNLMVYSAGNYRITDYWRFGLPVLVVYSITALTMITWVYGL